MIPYLILLILVLCCAKWYDSSKSIAALIISFAILTLFAGLRDVNVGTDSWNYYFQFLDKERFNDINIIAGLTHEGLFDVLVLLSQKLGNNYCSLFILIAMVVYATSLRAISQNTNSMLISMFVYIALGIAVFCYNGARQGIAIAIYMLSFKFLLKKKFLKYSAVVLIAALFHRTIIVAIPLYFIFTSKWNFKTIVFVIISSMVLVFALPSMIKYASILDQKYEGYIAMSEGGGEYLAFAYIIMTVFFIYSRAQISQQEMHRYDSFLLMFLSGTIIFSVVILAGLYIEISRFASYFHVAALFLWPMILKESSLAKNSFVKICFFMGHAAFMYIYYSRMAGLVPYFLNLTL